MTSCFTLSASLTFVQSVEVVGRHGEGRSALFIRELGFAVGNAVHLDGVERLLTGVFVVDADRAPLALAEVALFALARFDLLLVHRVVVADRRYPAVRVSLETYM